MVTIRTIWEVSPTRLHRSLAITPCSSRRSATSGGGSTATLTTAVTNAKTEGFVTANELHIPAGAGGISRPVYLTLQSADVCHSFWVPRLAGKTDMIPGRTNYMWLQTDRPDVYLGQCGEFCGSQHANMLIRVAAEPVRGLRALAGE